MEISSFGILADLGMDDHHTSFNQQWQPSAGDHSLNNLNSVSIPASIFSDQDQQFDDQFYDHDIKCSQLQPFLDFKRVKSQPFWADYRPLKQLRTENNVDDHSNAISLGLIVKPKEEAIWSTNSTTPTSVVDSKSKFAHQNMINHVLKPRQGTKRIIPTAQEHILAERRRREKLSQRFIALSSLVPDLKKMDKASVLEDAIKYMKQLQEKVKALEDQTKRRTVESVVFVKKYEVSADGTENSSSNESFSGGPTMTMEPLPEIEARVYNKDVLISIHCEKRKGVLEKTVAEIEKLNLSVVNSSVMTFGESALNITMVAKKDEGFCMNMKEVVKNLRCTLKVFM